MATAQFQNAKEYIKKKIAEVDALIDTRDSTGVGDILIKPLVAILQPVVDELTRIGNNQSLINGLTMSEEDLDALIANIFLTRSAGQNARGSVRIFFSAPVAITVPAASEFVDGTGLRFFSNVDVTITANQMSLNKDGDFFYVDIAVTAELPGAAGNVAAGSIVDFVSGPSTIIKVDNPAPFEGGADRETNAALIDRAKEAITVRDLVSKPAIKTVLLEKFSFIRDLRVIGYGDQEMERDFLIGTNMTLGLFPPIDVLDSTTGLHIGGKVDTYIRTVSLTTEVLRIDNVKQEMILRPQDAYDPVVTPVNTMYVPLIKRPLIDVVSLQQIDVVTGDPIGLPLIKGLDWTYLVDNKTLRFSTKERNHIHLINGLVIGGSLLLTYKHSPDVITVQAYMDDEANRVATADLLTKFTNPAFVDFSMTYQLDPASSTTPAQIEALVLAFIDNLKVGATLEVSDIVNLLYQNGAEFVQLPFTVTVTIFNPDGTETVTSSQNKITIPKAAGYLPRNIVLTAI